MWGAYAAQMLRLMPPLSSTTLLVSHLTSPHPTPPYHTPALHRAPPAWHLAAKHSGKPGVQLIYFASAHPTALYPTASNIAHLAAKHCGQPGVQLHGQTVQVLRRPQHLKGRPLLSGQLKGDEAGGCKPTQLLRGGLGWEGG